MEHEGQAATFRQLYDKGKFGEIRSIYKAYQSHNPRALNLLSAASDDDIGRLVRGQAFSGEPAEHRLAATVSGALVDHVAWAITNQDCRVYEGERLAAADRLRMCYVSAEKRNHNGEAIDLFQATSNDAITAATVGAVVG